MEAVRLFERGTWWDIELRECWHLTLLSVTLFQKSLGIPSEFSDIKGWKWIENVKYEPTCSWKGLAFTLKCQVMRSWKVLVTCVWNSWWWKMFLAWRWQGECSAIVKMSSASYSGTSLSIPGDVDKSDWKSHNGTFTKVLLSSFTWGLWNKPPVLRWVV